MVIILIYFYALITTSLSLFSTPSERVTLNIKNGAIKGLRETTVDQRKTYYSFRAIPYAQPPIGDLRFKAPVPASNWSGVLDATSDGSSCVQANLAGSEDCLFINVYTPAPAARNRSSSNATNLPVMVWFYGGIFIRGDASYRRYSPDYFLDADVVYVSFNYRTGVFGFFSTSDEAAPGNWGLHDQILALGWIQDNIEHFGGDKNDVTVFGESAGAASISFLLQYISTEGMFHRAIMSSGTSLNMWALSRTPRESAFALGKILGVSTRNSTELVERLRTVDAERLMLKSLVVDIVETYWTNPLDGLVYAPCKETSRDGVILIGENYEYLKNGNFSRIPVMIGFNSQESLALDTVIHRMSPYLISYEVNPSRLVPIDLNLDNDTIRRYIADEIWNHYFPSVVFPELLNRNLTQFITDDQFVRPIIEAARLMSRYVPVYFYRFSYIENATAESLDGIGEGAAHASELNYMFANHQDSSRSHSDLLTSQRLIGLWTNFAKSGNPTPEENDLFDGVSWSTYDQGRFLDIGHSLRMSSDLRKYSTDFWRNVYDEYAVHPLDNY